MAKAVRLVYLRCPEGGDTLALPIPRTAVPVACPYHPRATLVLIHPRDPNDEDSA